MAKFFNVAGYKPFFSMSKSLFPVMNQLAFSLLTYLVCTNYNYTMLNNDDNEALHGSGLEFLAMCNQIIYTNMKLRN